MGVGEAKDNIKLLDAAVEEMALITGQRPAVRRAKKSIANSSCAKGSPSVRRHSSRSPHVRVSRQIGEHRASPRARLQGPFGEGVRRARELHARHHDQTIFPELSVGKIEKIKGMNITIVTTAQSDNESRALLQGLGIPFRKP